MSNLVEITGDDIAQLRDDDLRNLIGLLCEADYRSAGLPTRGIAWGGHQDAADGGVDVAYWGMLTEEIEPPSSAFVPRRHAVIQVKLPEMSASKIGKEMRPKPKDKILLKKHPKGILKQSIKDLIPHGGAYIIVSAKTDAAGVRLSERIEAMRDAVADDDPNGCLFVNFLDQGQVANWVRNHPALILWVRNKIGRTLQGWKPYANWANPRGGVEEEYLLDDGLRLHDETSSSGDKGLSDEDGLGRLRSVLSVPGKSVRLVGLSGMGKTRLVQALFDERIGEQPLASSLAIYAEISTESLVPEPGAMAEQLVALRSRVILIIDNSPPDLHRRLTEICTQSESTVSLLTIEYDVQAGIPEETSLFKLEPASTELTCKLIHKRFSHISQVDAQTIADLSGGNARLAILLAGTVEQNETLSGDYEKVLFERLFKQRNDPDRRLLQSAEVCSLVYSFEGEDTSSAQSELQFLASFADKSAADLYRDVAELKRRELVQSRSVWQAVLPQAIANWLAKRALASIPKDVLVQKFQGTSERLMKSFSRRLGYLHNCVEAVEIVEAWLEPDGWIGKHVSNLSDSGMEVFVNIAPVFPAKTLAAIERAAQEKEEVFAKHQSRFVDLLQKLAYEPELFERCAHLLCRVALSEQEKEHVLKPLFYIRFSGLNTPVKEQGKIIEELMQDTGNLDKQNLAWHLLKAALTVWSFPVDGPKGFGARSREYNFYPEETGEALRWFPVFIDVCAQIALSNLPTADCARRLLADKLNGLWVGAGVFAAIEEAAKKIHAQKGWHQGWLAVRRILRKKRDSFSSEVIDRLSTLDEQLRPVTLLDQARLYAFSGPIHLQDLNPEDNFDDQEDDYTARRKKVEEITQNIACQVAQTPDVSSVLLPELVNGYIGLCHDRLHAFGKGLATGANDKEKFFQMLRSEFIRIAPAPRTFSVFTGFLASCAEIDPALCNTLLDELVEDEVFGEWFPQLQEKSCKIDQAGVERLHRSLDIGKAPLAAFKYLGWGTAYESLSHDDLAALVSEILTRENSAELAVKILAERTKSKEKQSSESAVVFEVMRNALCRYQFDREENEIDDDDHWLAKLANRCLDGPDGADAARTVCQRLVKAIIQLNLYANDYSKLVRTLVQLQPRVVLDCFFGLEATESKEKLCKLKGIFTVYSHNHKNPLDNVPDELLLDWCKINPEQRYPLVTSIITRFSSVKETNQIYWKPIVYTILEQAPNVEDVLKQLEDVIRPMWWSGFSRANFLEQRAALLQDFYEHKNKTVQNWARNQHVTLQKEIRRAKISDQELVEQIRFQDERFE